MGVWACSCGTLRFGARLSQEVLDTLVKKLAAGQNRYLERQDEGMFQHAFVLGGSDDEEDDGAVSLEDLNNRLAQDASCPALTARRASVRLLDGASQEPAAPAGRQAGAAQDGLPLADAGQGADAQVPR